MGIQKQKKNLKLKFFKLKD
uniref:Uncharacterized protein n=1 Tax=Anguilla anguilla TaxID=7936 RepID=A0A0E9VT64_ANGAN